MTGKAQLLQRLERLEQLTAKRSTLDDFYGERLCEKYAMFAALYAPSHEDYHDETVRH